MDQIHQFIFEGMPVRGMLVRLGASWREAMSRRVSRHDGGHAFPPPVRALLGEMAAAGCLLQGSLKFDGALILQMVGDGPVKLAVAEVQSDLRYRATAKVVGPVADSAQIEAMLNVQGQGRCAITLDPRGRRPDQQAYQGVVPLCGDKGEPLQQLSQVLEHYMLQSQQLDTRLVLAANDEFAAGLLIQRMPVAGAANLAGASAARDEDQIGMNEDYKRIALLAGTLQRDELLTLDAAVLLRRLFWQETLRLFEPRQRAPAPQPGLAMPMAGGPAAPAPALPLRPQFACSCSRERVATMLRGLGAQEIGSLIAEHGQAEIGCDFCGAQYHFDPVDAAGLFTPGSIQPPAAAGLH